MQFLGRVWIGDLDIRAGTAAGDRDDDLRLLLKLSGEDAELHLVVLDEPREGVDRLKHGGVSGSVIEAEVLEYYYVSESVESNNLLWNII